MAFFTAFGYVVSVSETDICGQPGGSTKVGNCTNAALSTSADITEVKTYDDTDGGWSKGACTGASYTFEITCNVDFNDSGYGVLKAGAQGAPTGVCIGFTRTSPEMPAGCDSAFALEQAEAAVEGNVRAGSTETVSGLGVVSSVSEDLQAGNVATATFTISGIGPLVYS